MQSAYQDISLECIAFAEFTRCLWYMIVIVLDMIEPYGIFQATMLDLVIICVK